MQIATFFPVNEFHFLALLRVKPHVEKNLTRQIISGFLIHKQILPLPKTQHLARWAEEVWWQVLTVHSRVQAMVLWVSNRMVAVVHAEG